MWCPNISSFCARDQFCILPRMKKSMVLFHMKNFSYHVTLATYKRKLQHVGHMWVTSELFCGSNGSTDMTQVSTLLQWHTHMHMHTHTRTHTHTHTHTHAHTQAHKHCMIHKYIGYKVLIYLANT